MDSARSTVGIDPFGSGHGTVSVLIVDDNPDHAFLAARELRRGDVRFRPLLCSNGAGCLNALANERPQAVLLDYNLPDIDGLRLLHELRERAPHLPVVVVTGMGTEEIAVEAMKQGAADYVVKRGDYMKALPRVLRISIERFQLQAENERLRAIAEEQARLDGVVLAARGIAHEMNQDLGVILGRAEVLAMLATDRDPQLAGQAAPIREAALRLAEKITRLQHAWRVVARNAGEVGSYLDIAASSEARTADA